MTPSIGRIIHLAPDDKTCIAAIITGDIISINSGYDDDILWKFQVAAFPITGPQLEASRRVQVNFDTPWHDPKSCAHI